jgi:hypothetical protein
MQRGKTLLAAGLLFGLSCLSAQAALTPETVNGQNLVYDSGNNTTWTQDANLLGTWEGDYGSTSYQNIVTAIIDANGGVNGVGGVIHDTPNTYDHGTYTLTAADFGNDGMVDWWAAQAFVHYLDTQNYGGSSQWALPTSNAVLGDNDGSQLGELFYDELGGTAGNSIPSGPFSNLQAYMYWSGREYASNPLNAWDFVTGNGFQDHNIKHFLSLAWAVSPGQVSAVPVPGAVWLFGTGLLGLIGLKRRGHAG